MYYLCSLEVMGLYFDILCDRCSRRVVRFISVVIQGWWEHVVVILLETCCASKLERLVLMLSHIVWMELLVVNEVVN